MPNQPEYDEKELLQKTAEGDASAFKIVFTRYWDRIYSTALMFTKSPDTAKDLAQDVFVKIWEKRQKLAGIDKLEGYLFITARNTVFDGMRKKVLVTTNEEYLQEYFKDTTASPLNEYDMKELETIIHKGISTLPARQQVAFSLSRFEGLTHEEIAAKMGIARQTVKSHISRAIISLRKLLEEYTDKLPVLVWIFIFL